MRKSNAVCLGAYGVCETRDVGKGEMSMGVGITRGSRWSCDRVATGGHAWDISDR